MVEYFAYNKKVNSSNLLLRIHILMISNFSSIVSKIKNAYRKGYLELCIKNFGKSRVFLKKLTDDGFIRGFSIIDKKKLKIYLSYNSNMAPSLIAATAVTSIRKKNPAGSFNLSFILKDFDILYANNSSQSFHGIKTKEIGKINARTSQGIYLVK